MNRESVQSSSENLLPREREMEREMEKERERIVTRMRYGMRQFAAFVDQAVPR